MSAQHDDGGPAFPVPSYVELDDGPDLPLQKGYIECEGGLSIRDWFAGQVLAGVLGNNDVEMKDHHYAEYAYAIADAMLAARKGGAK